MGVRAAETIQRMSGRPRPSSAPQFREPSPIEEYQDDYSLEAPDSEQEEFEHLDEFDPMEYDDAFDAGVQSVAAPRAKMKPKPKPKPVAKVAAMTANEHHKRTETHARRRRKKLTREMRESLGLPMDKKPDPTSFSTSSGSVYFRHVPEDVTEEELRQFFEGVGPVKKVWLFRDKKSNNLMGFCDFFAKRDGEQAVRVLHQSDFRGCSIWLSYSKQNLSQTLLDGDGDGCSVYFRHVPDDATEEELRQFFEGVGPVKKIWLFRDKKTKDLMGFCHFLAKCDGERAVKELHRSDFLGHSIWVSHGKPQSKKHNKDTGDDPSAAALAMNSKVFVGNLPPNAGQSDLFNLFGACQGFVGCNVPPGKKYGFIDFCGPREAIAFVAKYHGGKALRNNALNIKMSAGVTSLSVPDAKARPETFSLDPHATVSVFVGNLPDDATESDLSDLFGSFEGFLKCRKSESKPYGFVDFNGAREAKTAVTSMKGTLLGTNRLKIQLSDTLSHGRGKVQIPDVLTPGPPMLPPPPLFIDQLRHHLQARDGIKDQICRYGRRCWHTLCENMHPDGREIQDDPSKCICLGGNACRRPRCDLIHPGGREIDKAPVGAAESNRIFTIHISNISHGTSADDLYEAFSVIKGLTSMRLLRDKDTDEPTGLGICQYKSLELALEAIQALQDLEVDGQRLDLFLGQSLGGANAWAAQGNVSAGTPKQAFNVFNPGKGAPYKTASSDDGWEEFQETNMMHEAGGETEVAPTTGSADDMQRPTKIPRVSALDPPAPRKVFVPKSLKS